jgi:hypothetical protein
MARALGVWTPQLDLPGMGVEVASAFEERFLALGQPIGLDGLGLRRTCIDRIIANSLENFNADPDREFVREQALLRRVLEACWTDPPAAVHGGNH